MNDKILEMPIDEAVAQYILNKLADYKAASEKAIAHKVQEAREEAFSFADKKVEEAKKEWSARTIQRLEEKNQQIADLQENFDLYKESLAEKVDSFLTNSKTEVRSLVEEEMRVDGEELKAQGLLEQIRQLVGTSEIKIEPIDETKVKRLEEDVEALKERVTQKDKANKALKARLHISKLLEGVPDADRKFFAERLSGAETIAEAEDRFAKTREGIKQFRVRQIEEEMENVDSRGYVGESYDDDFDFEDVTSIQESSDTIPDRWKELAGMK